MRAKWLKFGILASIKVRASGQCIAPKTRTTLILDRYRQAYKTTVRRLTLVIYAIFAEKISFAENKQYICRIICGE